MDEPEPLEKVRSNVLVNLQSKGTVEDVLVFAGFCLLAAISSKAFIQTLSDKVLREAREAKQRAKDLEGEVDEIEETVSEMVESDDTPVTQIETEAVPEFPHVTETQAEVLKALLRSRYTVRSPSGLAKDLKMEREDVLHQLEELRDRGHVRELVRKKGGIRWSISTSGRMVVETLELRGS